MIKAPEAAPFALEDAHRVMETAATLSWVPGPLLRSVPE